MTDTLLIVPGLNNSGAAHWQSLWQLKHPDWVRVMQQDWSNPELESWTAALDRQIEAARGKVLLLAHSFGCLASINRLGRRSRDVSGVMLVAPADPDKFGVAESLALKPLAVPGVVVGSRNDPWFSFEQARALARSLGSAFVDAGKAGHINAESGHGNWPAGERILGQLRARAVRANQAGLRLPVAAAAA